MVTVTDAPDVLDDPIAQDALRMVGATPDVDDILAKAKSIYRVPVISDNAQDQDDALRANPVTIDEAKALDEANVAVPRTQKPIFCIAVNISKVGLRKRVSSQNEAIETENIDRDMLYFSKDILQSAEYNAIKKFDSKTRFGLRKKTAGNSYLKAGISLVNPASLEQLDEWLTTRSAVRTNLLKAFIDALPKLKDEAAKSLGPLFDAADYPPAEVIATKFGFYWQVFTYPNVDALKEVSRRVWQGESQKFKSLFEEALNDSKAMLRAEVAGLVDHFVERVTPSEDGKKRRFNKSTVNNLVDFLATFEQREVANDVELQAQIKKMQDLLKGVDVKSLKKDDAFRETIAKNFETIKADLGKMVEVAPKRGYMLPDAEA